MTFPDYDLEPYESPDHPDHETIPLPFTMQPEAVERETIMVHMIVTGIATPLAKAFLAVPQTGLLSTRFTCYEDTVKMLLKEHVIPFHVHSLNIDATLERIWRAARAEL